MCGYVVHDYVGLVHSWCCSVNVGLVQEVVSFFVQTDCVK
jgi:hypothetical protein